MEGAKTIRLVSVFVVGVVMAMGGALIYALATQTPQERALLSQLSAFSRSKPISQSAKTAPTHQSTLTTTTAVTDKQDADATNAAHQPPVATTDETTPTGEILDAFLAKPKASTTRKPMPRPNSVAPVGRTNESAPVSAATPDPRSLNQIASLPAAQNSAVQPWPTESPKPPSPNSDEANHVTGTPRSVPHAVTLWSGTPLSVKVIDTLSTDRAKEGQLFRAVLQSPLISDSLVIAEAGSSVTGQVIESKRAGKLGSAPDLRLVLVEIHTTDNQSVRIETVSWDDRGQSHNPVTGSIKTAIGAVSDAVTSAARVSGIGSSDQDSDPDAKNRGNLVLPANTVLQFRLAAPVSLTAHAR